MEKTNVNYGKYSFLTRGYFYVGLLAIFAMICINNFSSLQIPAIPFLMVLFVVAIFCDRNELLALIACCVPFSVGFQYKFGILICLAVYFIKYHKDIKLKWPVIISFGFLAVWELIHVVVGGESFYEYLRDFCELILIAYVALTSLKKVDYTFIIRAFIIACLGIMVVLFIEQLNQNAFNFKDIFNGSFRFGQNTEDDGQYNLAFNPNMLGLMCNMCITGILQLIISKRARVWEYVFIVPFVFFGVMTMSRTFLLCLAVIVVMFLLAGKMPIKKKLIRAGIVAGVAILLVLLVCLLMPTVVEKFIGRFIYEDDISNGRLDLFVFYNKHIVSSFKYAMFGIGLQNVGGKLEVLYPEAYSICHNGIQQIFIAWGIPGFIGFVTFMYFVIRNALKKVKFSLVNYMPIILIVVYVQFGQFISAGLTLVLFALSIISINYSFENVHEDTETSTSQSGNGIFQKISKVIKSPSTLITVLGSSKIGRLISDRLYIKTLYYVRFKKKLNLDNPITFNEKLQWLKLNDRNPMNTVMVDKYYVKEYVTDKLGKDYVIQTIGVWDKVEDFDFDKLPNQFVLKCTHNSGGLIICKDKDSFNIQDAKQKLNKALRSDYYGCGREWPYKNVIPKIIAEKFVKDKNNEFLPVYKVMCFSGEPKVIQTIQNDKQPNETIDYFSTDWENLNIRQNYPNSENPIEKPDCLEEMLNLSRLLAKNRPFIRIDWYVVNGKLKFSEFTFYSDAGFAKFNPPEWDEKLGSYINLDKLKGKVSNGK